MMENGVMSAINDNVTWCGTLLITVATSLFVSVKIWKGIHRLTPPNGISANEQSVPLKEDKRTLKSGQLKYSQYTTIHTVYPGVHTLFEAFINGMELSRNGRCLGYRPTKTSPYNFLSFAEVFKRSQELGSAFIEHFGLAPGNSTNVGIYAKNSPEWFITCLGAIRYSMVTVPLYDTLGADAATYIVQQTEIQVIVVDDVEKIKRLLAFADKMPALKYIVLIGKDVAVLDAVHADAISKGIQLHLFEDVRRLGQSCLVEDVPPSPQDTFIICYTSGTTGTPKGVVLSHENLVANISAFVKLMQDFMPEMVDASQSIISYLPLSHMFEQVCHWCMMVFGGSVGYYSGDIQHLTDDMKALKPTIFPVVPRLLNRFNDLIQSKLSKSGAISRAIFNFAYKQKRSLLKERIVTNKTLWDKLVFSKIQEQVGGNVRLMITGSAPISAEVLEICRVALGAAILEGYGQTECTAMATCTWPGDPEGGHCGGPAVCATVRLADVPELEYYAADGKGEVLIKGPSVTSGYYKDPEKTAELFDAEGFLKTGDIGQLLPSGAIKIIDRRKHIFKLAQGEYVAPEKIENIYVRSQFVQQIFVDGNSLERFLLAIVVPESPALLSWYEKETGKKVSIEEACSDPKVVGHVLEDLQKLGKENKLNSIEQVKGIHLEPAPWTVENGLLTPTLKSKRPQLRQKYDQVMTQLYRSM